jgi:hypothetical protein
MQQKFLCHSFVGFCLFTMNGNVKFLKAAGFSACEFERSENEQVEKPADFQEYVNAT